MTNNITILLSATPAAEERAAANELATHLAQALQVTTIPILTETAQASATKPVIYVGNTAKARQHGFVQSALEPEEWILKNVAPDELLVCGSAVRGTLYAAYELLEREYGVMWLDEQSTVIPQAPHGYFPKDLDLQGCSTFSCRCLHSYFRTAESSRQLRLFKLRQRQNLFHDENDALDDFRNFGLTPIFGSPRSCHTYFNYTQDLAVEDEDVFSLVNGQRLRAVNPSGPGQICFSNPKTLRVFTEKLKEFIKKDQQKYGVVPAIYDISANDNPEVCECPECQRRAQKYGSYSGLVLEFTNAIAAAIENEYPEVKIQMFAYQFAEVAPKGIKAHKNVLIRIAQLGCEFGRKVAIRDSLHSLTHPVNAVPLKRIQEWSEVGAIGIWDYWIMYFEALTTIGNTFAENLAIYKNSNVKTLFIEAEEPMITVFYAARLYLGYRFINDPTRNYDAELDKFMAAYYQDAAAPMRKLMKYMEMRNNEIAGKFGDVVLSKRTDLDDAFFLEAERLLDEAEALAPNHVVRKRIAKERLVVDRTRLLRRAALAPFDYNFVARRLLESFQLCKDLYLDEGQCNAFRNKLNFLVDSLTVQLPPAEYFKDYKVYADIAWPYFNEHSPATIKNAPDATGGRAVEIKGNSSAPITFGYFDETWRVNDWNMTIPKEEIPQDGSFHFYRLGKITLSPQGYFYVANPGKASLGRANEFYQPDSNSNEYEAFFSIKFIGKDFATNASEDEETQILLDRVLLVTPDDQLAALPAASPL